MNEYAIVPIKETKLYARFCRALRIIDDLKRDDELIESHFGKRELLLLKEVVLLREQLNELGVKPKSVYWPPQCRITRRHAHDLERQAIALLTPKQIKAIVEETYSVVLRAVE